MSSHIYTAAGLVVALIVLPIVLVRAQAAETTASSTEESSQGDAAPGTVQEEAAASPEESAPEETTPAVAQEEPSPTDEPVPEGGEQSSAGDESTESEPAVVQVPGADGGAAIDHVPSTEAEVTSATTSSQAAGATASEEPTTAAELQVQAASSTASSTPVTDEVSVPAKPHEEPFVLQPAVTLQINGSSLRADIVLENLTCRACAKALPALDVHAYYTAWHPNDGPEMKEGGSRNHEQSTSVADVPLWGSRSMHWSADGIASGRYYFVVVVDSDNTFGAYRVHRSEFSI